jgi:hypothetical protein
MALLDEQPYIGYPQMGRRRAMPNRDVEMNQGLLRGASYYPYDLLGSPVDLINMGLKPLGMGSQKPVMGSDYLQSLAQQYGLSQQPTGSNAENVARLAISAMNPATGARAVGRAIEPTMQALGPKAGQMAEDYLRSIGGIANIVPTDVARSINMPTTLPTDDIFKRAVENTPGATVTEGGLLMNVMRKQKPQQAETESVRGGVFYLPEGSPSMKHYGGTNYYGGTEKISGETLYKNPLVVKGATGGKAPEAAYEQLAGKQPYKEMQNEVSQIISDYGSGNVKVVVDGVATDSPVANRILRMGGNPDSFIESMQTKLNTQKQALEKASREEVLPGVSEYDIAKMDLDSTISMIDEAKSYVGKTISNKQSTIVDVENFLDKYAPDLSGYGSYIIGNSKQGNQLKYALQEAAVAQKARDAGYDAVIGYSKKKSGDPFLSEIFDVREAIYPSREGDYRLMDKFEGLLD